MGEAEDGVNGLLGQQSRRDTWDPLANPLALQMWERRPGRPGGLAGVPTGSGCRQGWNSGLLSPIPVGQRGSVGVRGMDCFVQGLPGRGRGQRLGLQGPG